MLLQAQLPLLLTLSTYIPVGNAGAVAEEQISVRVGVGKAEKRLDHFLSMHS